MADSGSFLKAPFWSQMINTNLFNWAAFDLVIIPLDIPLFNSSVLKYMSLYEFLCKNITYGLL